MEQTTLCDEIVVVPPPRRHGKVRTLGIHAVQLVTMLGLPPMSAAIERFLAAAKRYYHLDSGYAIGWESVLLRVTLTFCAILAVALVAYQ